MPAVDVVVGPAILNVESSKSSAADRAVFHGQPPSYMVDLMLTADGHWGGRFHDVRMLLLSR